MEQIFSPLYEPNIYIHYHTLPYSILGDANALLKIDSISPADGSFNKQTKLNVRATSTSTYQGASMTAEVEIVVWKKIFFGSVKIMDFIYGIISPTIEKLIPGLKHIKNK